MKTKTAKSVKKSGFAGVEDVKGTYLTHFERGDANITVVSINQKGNIDFRNWWKPSDGDKFIGTSKGTNVSPEEFLKVLSNPEIKKITKK